MWELSAKPALSVGSLICLLKAVLSFHRVIDTAEEGGCTSSFLPFPSANNFHGFVKDDKVFIFFLCSLLMLTGNFRSCSIQGFKRKTKVFSIFCVPGTDLSVFLWAFFSLFL